MQEQFTRIFPFFELQTKKVQTEMIETFSNAFRSFPMKTS